MTDARTPSDDPKTHAMASVSDFTPATTGERLRVLRRAARLDPAAMADLLGLTQKRYLAFEADAKPLPAALLPALSRAFDIPLADLVADLHGADVNAAELHTLATAFDSIENPVQREALLSMALALSDMPA